MLMRLRSVLRSGMFGRLARDRRGVSAIEFALLAPLLVTMLGGAVELSGAITAGNRATYVADAIGELASQASGTLSTDLIDSFIRTAGLMNPDVVRYAAQSGRSLDKAIDITVSSIQFELADAKCKANCQYDGFVVFSRSLSGAVRPCGKVATSTLPAGVYSPGTLVVVDVAVRYRPLMKIITGGNDITFKRATYFRPRYVSRVNSTANCPAYPL